ncbi:hypothetical protein TSAR_013758 [Trichomalopsis sarcophagae]|uniref:Uncharacterized protein n=1 Tax=Trichomalopsis sarcophagae TaxID=543379 RepID=A0A232FN97_9HYME|nr:hypothetical protein TSAR_013758 [Trichomalopsis sarcophagae]
MDEKERRLHVDNNDCMLLEFVNDSNSLAVGYLNWLKEDDLLEIQNLIKQKKEVEVMWPDCTIKTAVYMKAMLQKATFSTHVVRILDVGDWTTVQKHKTNLITYGEISPSKDRRKELKAKNIISNEKRSKKKITNSNSKDQTSLKNTSLDSVQPQVILQEILMAKESETPVERVFNISYYIGDSALYILCACSDVDIPYENNIQRSIHRCLQSFLDRSLHKIWTVSL